MPDAGCRMADGGWRVAAQKKARNLRASNSAISIAPEGISNSTVTYAKQNPGKRLFCWRNICECAVAATYVQKNSPLKWRAENQLKKALSSGHGKCMKSVAAAALGNALIGRRSVIPASLSSSATFGARRSRGRRNRIQHAADGGHATDHRAALFPLIDTHALGLAEGHRMHRAALGRHRSESHGRPRGFGWKASGKTPPWRAGGSPPG